MGCGAFILVRFPSHLHQSKYDTIRNNKIRTHTIVSRDVSVIPSLSTQHPPPTTLTIPVSFLLLADVDGQTKLGEKCDNNVFWHIYQYHVWLSRFGPIGSFTLVSSGQHSMLPRPCDQWGGNRTTHNMVETILVGWVGEWIKESHECLQNK